MSIVVKDGNGAIQTIETLPAPVGGSLPVTGPLTDAQLRNTPVPTTAALAAGENHFGKVGGETVLIDIAFSLTGATLSAGVVMADTQVVTNALRVVDGTGILQSITLIDEDDQGAAMFVVILRANNSLGTENSAPTISDANAREIVAVIPVATTDWLDLGGVKVANIKGIGAVLKSVSGSRDLCIGVINGAGTPTVTAVGLRGRLGIMLD